MEREKDRSPFTWSHGTQTSLISFNCERTTAKKKTEPEIYSTQCGFLISLWRESKLMDNGHSSALMKLLASIIVMERNLCSFILNMNSRNWGEKLLRHKNYGKLSLKVKLKQALHTCSIKTMLTPRVTISIWELSRALICVVRLLNTLHLMKLLSVTWHLSHYLDMLKMEHLTLKNFTL